MLMMKKAFKKCRKKWDEGIPLDQIYYLESEGRVINVYGDIAREHSAPFTAS